MNKSGRVSISILGNVLRSSRVNCIRLASHTRLLEVGRLITPKVTGDYPTGQLFLHKLFSYRGVILFPWPARVYNRNQQLERKREDSEERDQASDSVKEVKGEEHTFYSALMDTRDTPFIRAQTEAVTFLGHQESGHNLFAIPGLDYVAHEHVLPYTATQGRPLHHDLLDKFLDYKPDEDPQFGAKDTLLLWQKRNRPWLQLSEVHTETTEDVRVTVIPFYMGCRDRQTHWWRYRVCLERLGGGAVRLRERHWRIFSLAGVLETVRGRGVVGQEPVLTQELPAFQYSSHVSLLAPSGHMWGSFRMEREDGHTFDCRVPPFALESTLTPAK